MVDTSKFIITDAVRELVFTKIALMGASGSGKTYSALRLAKGMSQELEKIHKRPITTLMANTEKSRGRYYADEFTYRITEVNSPFEPEKFVDLIAAAVELKYDILILDSTSPEWEGDGGCLDLHLRAGGRYQDWGKITPRHNKFLLALAESPIHIIATMRGKDQYEMDNSEGKTVVTKLGVGAKQREGFEYEFTTTFLLDQRDNFAEEKKDNTHLFEKAGRLLLTEEHGVQIIRWANSGKGYTPKVYLADSSSEVLASTKKLIIDGIKAKGGSKNPALVEYFKTLNITLSSKGVDTIQSSDTAKEILDAIEKIEEIK